MVWWFSCLVVWLFGGLVVWLFGGLVVWWFGCLVVWWFGGLVVWWSVINSCFAQLLCSYGVKTYALLIHFIDGVLIFRGYVLTS